MGAFIYGVSLRWRLDIRNRGVLLTYYVVPLLFFAFMGGVFSSINPYAKDTLIQTMTIFGVTMGAMLGSSMPLVEIYGSDIKKAYKVGGIPLWVEAVNNFLSAFIHMFIVSLIIYIVSPIAFEASVPENPGIYFLATAIFIVASLSVGTMLGLVVKNASRLTMVSQFAFLPSIMLSGIMFPADMLPEMFGTVGKIFPATWGMVAMTSTSVNMDAVIPMLIITGLMLLVSGIQLKRV